MQRIQQPTQERNRIALLGRLEFAIRSLVHLLQKLVRTSLRLEKPWIPDSLCQQTEPFHELGRFALLFELRRPGIQEEIAHGWDMQEEVNDHIGVIVCANVVQTDVAWEVWLCGEGVGRSLWQQGEGGKRRRIVSWVENVDNILQGRV